MKDLGSLSSRRIRLGLAAVGVVVGLLVVPPWISATVPAIYFHRAGRALLLVAQPAYVASAVALMAGLAISGARVAGAGRRGVARPWSARMALLCASGLLSIVGAEIAVGAIRAHRQRHPSLVTPTEPRGPRDLNVVVIGGSSAFGLPFEAWLSTGHIVAWKLGESLPDRRVHLEILAEVGEHLEHIHKKLSNYRRPIDLLIVYSGHNEFTRRYAWSRTPPHYRDETPFRPIRLFRGIAPRWSPVFAMIQESLDAQGLGEPPPPEIPRQLVDLPLCTPEEHAERLKDFTSRLEAIVDHYERTGAVVVVVVPPANLSGFEPNRSILPPNATRADRSAFARRFLQARELERSNPSEALESYRRLLAEQPGFAETHYRMGRLLERSGSPGEAAEHYRAALDLDALPMRCPSDFQRACREVSARHPRTVLVDGPAAMAAAGRDGIAGDRLFLDAMHPSVRGHAALAGAILAAMKERRVLWPEGTPCPPIDPGRCADHFRVDARTWKVACEWGATFYERTAPIRYDPTVRRRWIDRYRAAAKAIAEGVDAEDVGLPGIGVRSGAGVGARDDS